MFRSNGLKWLFCESLECLLLYCKLAPRINKSKVWCWWTKNSHSSMEGNRQGCGMAYWFTTRQGEIITINLHVLLIAQGREVAHSFQGSYRSWKTFKVMEFYNFIFQAWKVLKSRCGSRKVMENQYVFYEWKALRSKVEKLTGKSKNQT